MHNSVDAACGFVEALTLLESVTYQRRRRLYGDPSGDACARSVGVSAGIQYHCSLHRWGCEKDEPKTALRRDGDELWKTQRHWFTVSREIGAQEREGRLMRIMTVATFLASFTWVALYRGYSLSPAS